MLDELEGDQMKYIKASEILPDHLMNEIQKYVDGGLVYFPKRSERRPWGSNNGTKEALKARNLEIQTLYGQGETLVALSKRFCLSEESVRKILKTR